MCVIHGHVCGHHCAVCLSNEVFGCGNQGSVNDQEFMEKTLKEHEIDIVISAVGGGNLLEQVILIRAMKAVGTIKVRK